MTQAVATAPGPTERSPPAPLPAVPGEDEAAELVILQVLLGHGWAALIQATSSHIAQSTSLVTVPRSCKEDAVPARCGAKKSHFAEQE